MAYGQYVFEVSDELDKDPSSPTYLKCINWTPIPDTLYSFVEVNGVKEKFDYQDNSGLTLLDEQTWQIPVEFDNISPDKEMEYYHIKFLASAVGVFPSATVLPIQGSGKPTPTRPIPPGAHTYWFRAKVGLLDYSNASPSSIMVIKTSSPGKAE
jgi:hypothetical protein